MKLRSMKFYITEAIDSLFKNKLMAIASIITVASCIFILSISFCIAQNINYAMKTLNESIGLFAIISDDLPADKVDGLYEKILSIPYVSSVKFISSADALKELSETLDDSADILKGLEQDNPLPRAFEISLKDNKNYSNAVEALEQLKTDGIHNVKHARDETNLLLSVSKIVRIISFVIIICLALISIVIIVNTIKLAVNNRRDEISIMKYIGATNSFIRWPFIIEGVVIGLIGSLIPVFVSWFCYDKLVSVIYNRLPILEGMFQFKSSIAVFSELLPLALGLGVFIGVIGSLSATQKYLNV